MTEQEIMIEAHDTAMIKTEEDNQYGIVPQLYDESGTLYTSEARKAYREHYYRELKRLSNKHKIKLSEI